MSKAYESFQIIDNYENIQDKHMAWLMNYEGLNYSFAFEEKHKRKWRENPLKYKNEDFRLDLNMIARKKDRLIIEFDDEPIEKARENLEKTAKKLKKLGFGFIRSTHKGKCDYLWVEFARDLTTEEAKLFLDWISPLNSIIDLNFTSDNKLFPVLYAIHWKHSLHRELPIEYFKGNKIDFDSLNIPKKQIKTKTISKKGFEYEVREVYEKPIRLKEFLGVKQEKEKPIIKNFIPEKAITIIFGEPASCKSIFLNYLGCCIASGKKFLEQYPIRKLPVLLISSENPEKTDRKRLKSVLRALRVNAKRRKYDNLMFSICGRDKIGLLSDKSYFNSLERTIKENKIKVLLIDTISPLISDLNDNLANEIIKVFKERLFSLVDEYDLSIIMTMHSQKSGKDFLGSVKIKASCDSLFEIQRNEENLTLLCHKNRDGEHNLKMNILFENKKEDLYKINLSFIEEFQGKKNPNTKNQTKTENAKEIIINLLAENKLSWNEIKEISSESSTTTWRALKSLYEDKKISKERGKGGKYYLV